MPRPDERWSPLEAGTFSRLHELDGFPAAVDALAPTASPDPVGDLTLTFSRALLDRPAAVIPLVHTVTPAVASRTLLTYAPDVTVAALYAQLWQVDAAIVAGFTPPGPALRHEPATTTATTRRPTSPRRATWPPRPPPTATRTR